MRLQVRRECGGVAGIDIKRRDLAQAMSARDGAGGARREVRELHEVAAGVGEQPGDEAADLAGAQDEYTMHVISRKSRPGLHRERPSPEDMASRASRQARILPIALRRRQRGVLHCGKGPTAMLRSLHGHDRSPAAGLATGQLAEPADRAAAHIP
jgi:hypothetical protein